MLTGDIFFVWMGKGRNSVSYSLCLQEEVVVAYGGTIGVYTLYFIILQVYVIHHKYFRITHSE